MLFVVVTLHLTMRAHEGRTRLLAWLVPLTVLWTNLHGGFFVVFLILGCYIASDLLNAVLDKDAEARAGFLRTAKAWAPYFAACLLATFLNPYGWELHHHVISYLTDPYSLQHISEFQAVNFHAPVVVYFEPLMALAIAVAFFDIRNRRFAEVFLSMGWLHLALIAQRNVPLFAICAAPAVARGVMAVIAAAERVPLASWVGRAAVWFRHASASFEETDRIGRVYLASAVPLMGVAAILLLTPPRAGVLDNKFMSTYDPAAYPEKALSLLRGPETRHIFAEDEWGDYLIYHLYPAKKVFVDGRSDFYGDDFGEKYLNILNARYDWQQGMDKYGIDTIVIAPKFALATLLKISPDWRLVYDDKVALVFRRNLTGPRRAAAGTKDSFVTSNGGTGRDRAITKTINRDRTITQPAT